MIKDKKVIIKRILNMRLVIVILLFIIIVPLSSTLSRFINRQTINYYLESQNFYFTSDKLANNNPTYTMENWSGVENFTMGISLESRKNELEVTNEDVTYNISYECGEGVTCALSKENGTIYSATNIDNVSLILVPTRAFQNGESTTVRITAVSTYPYVKTIKARFIIRVTRQGLAYQIEDEAHSAYLNLKITNSRSFYTVDEAFLDYSVNEEIDYDEYKNLSDENKAKCRSAEVALDFNPQNIILDTTLPIMKRATTTTQLINGIEYINGITFRMDALSSDSIRFYKKDKEQDYTYPITNENSIIDVEIN